MPKLLFYLKSGGDEAMFLGAKWRIPPSLGGQSGESGNEQVYIIPLIRTKTSRWRGNK